MAPSIRIPDGFVFVKRADGVARKLLDAADAIEADRHLGVRTVTGGYHVTEAIAEEYQKGFPAAAEEDDETEGGTEVQAEEVQAEEVEAEEVETEDVETPDESWTVAQIDEWAGKQEPAIEFPADVTKKADKLAFLSKPAE